MVSLSSLPQTRKHKFETATVLFAASIRQAETSFLYAGWYDPCEMLDVACDLSLDHSSLTDPEAQFIFCYLACLAEFSRQNSISVGECVRLALDEGIAIDGNGLADDILRERAEFPGDIRTEIRSRGEILKRAVQNRIKARAHLQAVCGLIGDDGVDELLSGGTRTSPTRLLRGRILV